MRILPLLITLMVAMLPTVVLADHYTPENSNHFRLIANQRREIVIHDFTGLRCGVEATCYSSLEDDRAPIGYHLSATINESLENIGLSEELFVNATRHNTKGCGTVESDRHIFINGIRWNGLFDSGVTLCTRGSNNNPAAWGVCTDGRTVKAAIRDTVPCNHLASGMAELFTFRTNADPDAVTAAALHEVLHTLGLGMEANDENGCADSHAGVECVNGEDLYDANEASAECPSAIGCGRDPISHWTLTTNDEYSLSQVYNHTH